MEKIIEILKEDSRATVKDIAVMLNKPEEEIQKKIKKLEDDNIILKYTTVINEEKWEEEKVTAFIELDVNTERGKGFDSIAERIYRFKEVRSFYLMSGKYDLLLMVEGKSLKEIANFVSNKLATLKYVNATDTHFLLKKYKENGISMIPKNKKDNRIKVMP
ncbi:MAG: Lrp/AsnC family transcriptional regulator [Fusobacteriota bacterium]